MGERGLSERHLLIFIVLLKIGVSVTDVGNRWLNMCAFADAIDNVDRLALDMKEKALQARQEVLDSMAAMCNRQAAAAAQNGKAFRKCLVPKQAAVDDFLIQVDESLREQKRTEEDLLPRRRLELWMDGADLALEAANAAARAALLAALVWSGGKYGRLSQAAAALALGGPLIKLGIAWAISVSFWERKFWDMYTSYVLLPKWLYGQYSYEWTKSTSMWPLLLLLIYPVVDHEADHKLWAEYFLGSQETAVDIVFYILHLYYYVLIKDFWSEQRLILRKTKRIRPTIKKLRGLKPFARPKDALMHACIYGHLKRVRSILRQPNLIKQPEMSFKNGPNCLHVAAIKKDVVLAKLLIDATLKLGGENSLISMIGKSYFDGGERRNFAEMVAASGSLDLAKCLFKDYQKSIWEESCPPDRAIQLAQESGQEELVSQIKTWFSSLDPENEISDLGTEEMDSYEGSSEINDEPKWLHKIILGIGSLCGNKNDSERDETTTTAAMRLSGFFECPVCMEVMSGGARIFACSNDHWLCASCTGHEQVSNCPICREDFTKNKPRRCLTAEKIADSILSNKINAC